MRSQFLAAAFMILLTSPSASQSPTPDRLQRILDNGTLRVGTTMDTPVFSMRTSSGQLEGFTSSISPCRAMGRTLDRARTATFSKPYMRYGKLMVVRNSDKDRFKSIAELDKTGIKIAYNKGGLNETFAKTMFKQAPPTAFDSNALATAALLEGNVDAQVADSTAALYMARQDARIAVMDPANVFNPVYVAILLHREDQTLLNYLNIWIDQIQMDGTLAKIRGKWLGDVR
jgi:ABC-type amino acid transport substrate-binding protein